MNFKQLLSVLGITVFVVGVVTLVLLVAIKDDVQRSVPVKKEIRFPNYVLIRQVKKGMTSNELVSIMGEPDELVKYDDSETWSYDYQQKNQSSSTMTITIENDSIQYFHSF